MLVVAVAVAVAVVAIATVQAKVKLEVVGANRSSSSSNKAVVATVSPPAGIDLLLYAVYPVIYRHLALSQRIVAASISNSSNNSSHLL